jgi:Skp family chaperone for outer membrane proteins
VTDNETNLRWVGLNRPITAAEALQQKGVQVPPPELLEPETAAQMGQVVGIENEVAVLDVDIILDEAPDAVTVAQEQFEQLTQMVQAGLQIPPDIIIEASSLRNKEQLLERMRSGGQTPEQQQAAQQAQQQQQAIQQQAIQLDFGDKQATIEKKQAETAKIVSEIHQTAAATENTKVDGLHRLRELMAPAPAQGVQGGGTA